MIGTGKAQKVPCDVKAIAASNGDCVYMLLHEGWAKEERGNRWHFATRWARYLPVTIVVPETIFPWHVSAQESRFPNCRILKVVANRGEKWSATARIQIAQIKRDMELQGYRRPILWLYNAFFAEAYTALQASARVHHVTENYYDFRDMAKSYLDRVADISAISDLNVCVSEGCAKPLEPFASANSMMVVSNGCDLATYGAEGEPDAEAIALRCGFRKLAVFAGNINDRIDFALVGKLADSCPDIVFLFVGVIGLNRSMAPVFRALLSRPNVRYWKTVSVERLAAIYRAADIGFMPFVQNRLNVENGFPLKTMEMAATGLPVVSVYLRPLAPLSPPLSVARDDNDFIVRVQAAERSPLLAQSLRTLAAQNDYDVKFSAIVARLAERVGARAACFQPDIDSGKTDWSFRDLLPAVKYRYVPAISRFVDSLPDGLRTRIVTFKRSLLR
jgi:glycosyltransferase involved in cell wall biosynthesis